MAHPDDGYLIPDDEWAGMVHPETGENVYPDDRFATYRNFLINMRQEDSAGIARPDRMQRLEKLKRLRERALNGRLGNQTEGSQ
jgi:hypothetical protein